MKPLRNLKNTNEHLQNGINEKISVSEKIVKSSMITMFTGFFDPRYISLH